jgi:hypothetical protein
MPTAKWARIVIFLAAAAWFVVALVMRVPVDRAWIKPLGLAASIVVLCLLVFDLYLWRYLPSQLVGLPDLSGTWKATVDSGFNAPGGQEVQLIAYLVIRQTYSTIHVEMLFPKSESSSTSAAIVNTDGTSELWYSYRSEAHALDRTNNPPHKGAVQLRIAANRDIKLAGSYWTDRETFGRIETVSRRRSIINDYKAAEDAFAD